VTLQPETRSPSFSGAVWVEELLTREETRLMNIQHPVSHGFCFPSSTVALFIAVTTHVRVAIDLALYCGDIIIDS